MGGDWFPAPTSYYAYHGRMTNDVTITMTTVGALSTNCYICTRGDEAIVIDPGHGAHVPVLSYMDDHDLTVTGVYLTHGHLDHSRDAGIIANHFLVPVWLHQADVFMLEDSAGVFQDIDRILDHDHMEQPERVEYYDISRIDDSDTDTGGCEAPTNAAEPITDPQRGIFPEVAIGGQVTLKTAVGPLTVLGTPGHSPGSTMLFLGKTCFGGDVLFRGGIGRTNLPGSNPHSMKSTLTDVVKELPRKTMVLPGHGPSTTIDDELQQNSFLRGL